MNLSFKNRIALFNTIAAATTALLVFVAIYSVVFLTSYNHLEKEIRTEQEEVFKSMVVRNDSIIVTNLNEWDEAEHQKVEVNPTFLQVIDASGNILFHSSNMVNHQILYNPNIEDEKFFNSEISNQNIRLGQFAIKSSSGKILGHLSVAISRQESFTILKNLLIVMAIAFPLVLIIQFVVSYIAATRSLDPIHDLIETAACIDSSNIHTRVDLPSSQDEILDLAVTINELLDRVDQAIQHQKQFASDASHEMRTPVAAIKGNLEVLIRKQREPQQYVEEIKKVIIQTNRLENLLEQLLHLSRLESGASMPRTERISVLPMVQGIFETYKNEIQEKAIQTKALIPEFCLVSADKVYLELILKNLISNAIKYGKHDGSITVAWDNQNHKLEVRDNGIGIAPENLEEIFNRFYRVDSSRSSDIPGNGLGLAIVKKIAEMQDIQITIQSEVGIGTTFALIFPTIN